VLMVVMITAATMRTASVPAEGPTTNGSVVLVRNEQQVPVHTLLGQGIAVH